MDTFVRLAEDKDHTHFYDTPVDIDEFDSLAADYMAKANNAVQHRRKNITYLIALKI